MIKILYVIENIFFGGGERVFAQIINNLNRGKYEIHVACLPGGVFEEKIKDAATIHPFDARKGFIAVKIFHLAKIMKKNKIQIVNSQGGRADFFARIAAKIAKGPIVVSTVNMPVEGYDVTFCKKIGYIILDRFSEKFVDKFMISSEAVKERLVKKHRIPSEKIVKIYNGVEIDIDLKDEKQMSVSRKKILQELMLPEDAILVGTIGRLVWQKGLVYFIQAIKHIASPKGQMADKIRYLIVGEGNLRKGLENLVKQLGVENNVIFTGFRQDVKEILSALDIFVLPSIREGQPIALLEAMVMGKPIIATDIGGVRETIENNVSGILISPKDSSALAEAIIYLLSDNKKAQAIGQKAHNVVKQKFSVEQMVKATECVYSDLMKERMR